MFARWLNGYSRLVIFFLFPCIHSCFSRSLELAFADEAVPIEVAATAIETRSNTLEAKIDLPPMKREELFLVDLELTNGDASKPLSLRNASVGCGCIDITPMQELIPPGESGMLRLKLKPQTSSGVNWVQMVAFSLPDASVPNVILMFHSQIHSVLKADVSQVILSFKPAAAPNDLVSKTFNIEHSAPISHETLQVKGEVLTKKLEFELRKVSDTQSTLTISARASQFAFADTNLDFAIVDSVTKQAVPVTCLVRFQKTLEVLPARHVATLHTEEDKTFYQFNALICRYDSQDDAPDDANGKETLLVSASIEGMPLAVTVSSQNFKIARVVLKIARESLDEKIAKARLADPSFVPKIHWGVMWGEKRISSDSVLTIVNQ